MLSLTGELIKYFFLIVLIISPISYCEKYIALWNTLFLTSNKDEHVRVADVAGDIELKVNTDM